MAGDDQFPELIFGIAGPIGVDIAAICDSLTNALEIVGYSAHPIHLTEEMKKYPLREHSLDEPTDPNYFSDVSYKINYANALCKEAGSSATLARVALRAIALKRAELTKHVLRKSEKVVLLPDRPTAYVIRQLKRPDEVSLLRKVYGRQFILISAYGSSEERAELLEERIARTVSSSTPQHQVSCLAITLMARDASEDDHDFGQELRETFHRADVFIDGLLKHEMEAKLNRFIQAFFGRTDIAPSKDEYGMYAAKSASLRSSDLSRQVGAAVFTDDGELTT